MHTTFVCIRMNATKRETERENHRGDTMDWNNWYLAQLITQSRAEMASDGEQPDSLLEMNCI